MTVAERFATFRYCCLMHVHARLAYDAYFAAVNVAANGNIPFACAAYGPASCKSRENVYCGVRRGAQRTNNFEVIENDEKQPYIPPDGG